MKKQSGFTLIEMVVVMVILGILAAVALPKFVDMSSQARIAKMNGAVGSVQSSVTLVHAKWLAVGSPSGSTPTVDVEGGISLVPSTVTDMAFGYPAASAFGTATRNLAGLDSSYTTSLTGTVLTVADSTKSTTCKFTVTSSTVLGTPPAIDVSALTAANC